MLKFYFCFLQLAWLHGLSPDTSRFIVVVRDPRDWIYALTRDDLTKTRKQRLVIRWVVMIKTEDKSKLYSAVLRRPYFQTFSWSDQLHAHFS